MSMPFLGGSTVSDLGTQQVESGWNAPAVPAGGASGPRAGFWRRFAALFVDGLILGVANVILIVLVSSEVANALSLLIGVGYYTYFEGGATGQTLGKRALGIRVIDARAGGPIGYGRGLLRYVARILSTIPLFLGYFWMLWDPEKQTWHDKIATTYVVPVDAYPVR
jgi:uncharacterized RDD family membrane protein YckC